MAHSTYLRGEEYPHEAFVQEAIEKHFTRRGFQLQPAGDADLVCSHPSTGETWVVEAKGVTTGVGLDLDTGLGQLLRRMHDPDFRYALAVPDVPVFRRACARLPQRVRQALGIHWLLVHEDGSVRRVAPDEPDPG